jgi:hypothetical protein
VTEGGHSFEIAEMEKMSDLFSFFAFVIMYVSHALIFRNYTFISFMCFSIHTAIISLNSVNQLIFVMVKCGVLFEVRTEFLNNI